MTTAKCVQLVLILGIFPLAFAAGPSQAQVPGDPGPLHPDGDTRAPAEGMGVNGSSKQPPPPLLLLSPPPSSPALPEGGAPPGGKQDAEGTPRGYSIRLHPKSGTAPAGTETGQTEPQDPYLVPLPAARSEQRPIASSGQLIPAAAAGLALPSSGSLPLILPPIDPSCAAGTDVTPGAVRVPWLLAPGKHLHDVLLDPELLRRLEGVDDAIVQLQVPGGWVDLDSPLDLGPQLNGKWPSQSFQLQLLAVPADQKTAVSVNEAVAASKGSSPLQLRCRGAKTAVLFRQDLATKFPGLLGPLAISNCTSSAIVIEGRPAAAAAAATAAGLDPREPEISVAADAVTLGDLELSDNRAKQGAGVWVGAGRVVRVRGVKFTRNIAQEGAGMLLEEGAVLGSLTNSVFHGNRPLSPGDQGSAIRFQPRSCWSPCPITNSTFINNQGLRGGAINTAGISSSCLKRAFDMGPMIMSSVFRGNEAQEHGGAVFLSQLGQPTDSKAYIHVFNTLFENNKAKGSGGAIWSNMVNGLVLSNYSMLAGNTAGVAGGGIWATSSSSSFLRVDSTAFFNNTAGSLDKRFEAAAIQLAHGSMEGASTAAAGALIGGGGAVAAGGSMAVAFNRAQLVNNTAVGFGGGFYCHGCLSLSIGTSRPAEGDSLQAGSVWSGNKAASGGALAVSMLKGPSHIADTIFEQNAAAYHGYPEIRSFGGDLMGGQPAAGGSTGNRGAVFGPCGRGGGGAVCLQSISDQVGVSNCTFTGNTARFGGALFFEASVCSNLGMACHVNLQGSTFAENEATSSGSDLYLTVLHPFEKLTGTACLLRLVRAADVAYACRDGVNQGPGNSSSQELTNLLSGRCNGNVFRGRQGWVCNAIGSRPSQVEVLAAPAGQLDLQVPEQKSRNSRSSNSTSKGGRKLHQRAQGLASAAWRLVQPWGSGRDFNDSTMSSNFRGPFMVASNQPFDVFVRLKDSFGNPVEDTDAPPTLMLSSLGAAIRQPSAEPAHGGYLFSGVDIMGPLGPQSVAVTAAIGDHPIATQEVPVFVRRCLPGEVSAPDGSCRPCGLPADAGVPGSTIASLPEQLLKGQVSFNPYNTSCDPCPAGADLCDGIILTPTENAWHSHPFSLLMHRCPIQGACSYSGRRQDLKSWREGHIRGAAGMQALLEQQGGVEATDSSSYSALFSANRTQAEASMASLALAEGPSGYTQLQCSEGYKGVLCGSCSPGYGSSTSLGDRCSKCLGWTWALLVYLLGRSFDLGLLLLLIWYRRMQKTLELRATPVLNGVGTSIPPNQHSDGPPCLDGIEADCNGNSSSSSSSADGARGHSSMHKNLEKDQEQQQQQQRAGNWPGAHLISLTDDVNSKEGGIGSSSSSSSRQLPPSSPQLPLLPPPRYSPQPSPRATPTLSPQPSASLTVHNLTTEHQPVCRPSFHMVSGLCPTLPAAPSLSPQLLAPQLAPSQTLDEDLPAPLPGPHIPTMPNSAKAAASDGTTVPQTNLLHMFSSTDVQPRPSPSPLRLHHGFPSRSALTESGTAGAKKPPPSYAVAYDFGRRPTLASAASPGPIYDLTSRALWQSKGPGPLGEAVEPDAQPYHLAHPHPQQQQQQQQMCGYGSSPNNPLAGLTHRRGLTHRAASEAAISGSKGNRGLGRRQHKRGGAGSTGRMGDPIVLLRALFSLESADHMDPASIFEVLIVMVQMLGLLSRIQGIWDNFTVNFLGFVDFTQSNLTWTSFDCLWEGSLEGSQSKAFLRALSALVQPMLAVAAVLLLLVLLWMVKCCAFRQQLAPLRPRSSTLEAEDDLAAAEDDGSHHLIARPPSYTALPPLASHESRGSSYSHLPGSKAAASPPAVADAASSAGSYSGRGTSSWPSLPRFLQDHLLTVSAVVVLYFYTTVTAQLLALFSCLPVDSIDAGAPYGEYFAARGAHWTQDYNVSCFQGEHLAWALAVGLPGVLLFSIGLPMVGFIFLTSNRKQLLDPGFRAVFAELYDGFKHRYYWWGSTRYMILLALTLVVEGLSRVGPTPQLIAFLALLTAYIFVTLSCLPWRRGLLNALSLVSLLSVLATTYMCLMFMGSATQGLAHAWSVITQVLIVAMNVLAIVVLLIHLVWATKHSLSQNHAAMEEGGGVPAKPDLYSRGPCSSRGRSARGGRRGPRGPFGGGFGSRAVADDASKGCSWEVRLTEQQGEALLGRVPAVSAAVLLPHAQPQQRQQGAALGLRQKYQRPRWSSAHQRQPSKEQMTMDLVEVRTGPTHLCLIG